MGFELKQQLKLGQNLMMTPALQQAIKLLQLSRLELEQYVVEQLAENPVLEEKISEQSNEELLIAEEREKEKTSEEVLKEHFDKEVKIVEGSSEDNHWDNVTKNQDGAGHQADESEGFNYENVLSKEKNLQEYLLDQISEVELNEEERKIATELIGNIDDKGYLATTIEDIAKQLNHDVEQIEDILDVVQRFEPNGVGARDLKECLLIQIRNLKLKNGHVEKIIQDHLLLLENRNFDLLAKKLNLSVEEIIQNVEIISTLDPNPGRQFHQDSSIYVVPDVYVIKTKNGWIVSLNQEGLPKLKINKLYSNMAESKKTKGEEKEYLQNKLKEANWLIKSIEQRQKTIMKVAQSILNRQLDFFEMGPEHLKPMILKDVANDIEMHESTVSRVTTNKFIHTPRGVFELKYFFSNSVSRSDGDDIASEAVKKMISDFVKSEDVKKPFSDQRIVEHLEEKGVQLARRTVAKYRENLGILPSSKRKKFY